MKKIYRIEFKLDPLDSTNENYIVSNSLKELCIWLAENTKYNIVKIEYIGNCLEA